MIRFWIHTFGAVLSAYGAIAAGTTHHPFWMCVGVLFYVLNTMYAAKILVERGNTA